MKTILVTGAGGYIGTELVAQLREEGHKVIGADRFFFGKELLGSSQTHPNFQLLQKDIRKLSAADFAGVDVVMDLAGLSNDPTAELSQDLAWSINFDGGSNVAKAAKAAGVKRFIYSSSCSVYGTGKQLLLTEESELAPATTYAQTKVRLEEELLKLQDQKFEVVILRNATVYGYSSRMRFDLVINLMTLSAWRDGQIVIMGGGKQWRPVVHIGDVVEAFCICINAPASAVAGEIFNVGSDEQNYQVFQLAYMIKSVFSGVKLITAPDDADKRSYNVSFKKIHETLNYTASRTPLSAAKELKEALTMGKIDIYDKRLNTLKHYQHLLEVQETFSALAEDGKII
ncbi:MAG: SDR family oxidoreductase [Bdellovibrionales bacterium]|nr:SDR family oxidoreductase [Bdellovibrionales bacterium]